MEFQKRPMKSKLGPIPSKQSSHIKIPNNGIGLLQNAPGLVLIRSKADCAIIWTRTIDLASQNNRLNTNRSFAVDPSQVGDPYRGKPHACHKRRFQSWSDRCARSSLFKRARQSKRLVPPALDDETFPGGGGPRHWTSGRIWRPGF